MAELDEGGAQLLQGGHDHFRVGLVVEVGQEMVLADDVDDLAQALGRRNFLFCHHGAPFQLVIIYIIECFGGNEKRLPVQRGAVCSNLV